MGNFRLVIDAAGGHGCMRDKKHGEKVEGCGWEQCPDCIARKFVAELVQRYPVAKAEFTHWPETPYSVTDDLVTGLRSGSFNSN